MFVRVVGNGVEEGGGGVLGVFSDQLWERVRAETLSRLGDSESLV